MQKRIFVVAPDLCSGCKSCEVCCSIGQEEGNEFNPQKSRIRVIRDELGILNIPLVNCDGNNCPTKADSEPTCVEMCPTGTLIFTDLEDVYWKRMELNEKRRIQPLFKLIVPWKYPYPWKAYREEE